LGARTGSTGAMPVAGRPRFFVAGKLFYAGANADDLDGRADHLEKVFGALHAIPPYSLRSRTSQVVLSIVDTSKTSSRTCRPTR
jgi:hypothetical protein